MDRGGCVSFIDLAYEKKRNPVPVWLLWNYSGSLRVRLTLSDSYGTWCCHRLWKSGSRLFLDWPPSPYTFFFDSIPLSDSWSCPGVFCRQQLIIKRCWKKLVCLNIDRIQVEWSNSWQRSCHQNEEWRMTRRGSFVNNPFSRYLYRVDEMWFFDDTISLSYAARRLGRRRPVLYTLNYVPWARFFYLWLLQ